MTSQSLHLATGHAVLIGTGRHASDSGLTDVEAVPRTLAAVADTLVERCGMDRTNISVHTDPATAVAMGDAVGAAVERAGDVLLVYYVGHGLVSQDGVLYLAAQTTDARPTRLRHTALPFATIREYLQETTARLVVVLDCCFSGRAVGTLSDEAGQVADLASIKGGFVLTSAGRDELALARPGASHTAFSGAMLDLLANGHPEWPDRVTLHDLYRYLARVLPESGAPRPRVRYDGTIGELVLTRNPRYRSAVRPVPGPARDEHAELTVLDCPYKGMATFEETDAARFFGRDRLVDTLVGRLTDRYDDAGLLVVTGASGVGKSSVLRAGVLPAIDRGALRVPGSAGWPRLLLTPTSYPMDSLERHVAGLGTDGRPDLATDPGRLRDVFRRLLRDRGENPAARVIVVVDQFEEVLAAEVDPAAREAFVDALTIAAHGGDDAPSALVVLALRADFFGSSARLPALLPALQLGQVVVGPMTADELRDVIERPARAVGLALEPGLVELLLKEMGSEPGRLPLLSHALRATFERRTANVLTVADYRETGGIPEAVARTAEAAFDRLDEPGRETSRTMLLRLVHLGDGTEDTRRRVGRDQLLAELPDVDLAARVLDAFTEPGTRLLSIDHDTVRITHEALLRAWPRLRDWIDEDRSGLLVQQHLADAARAWAAEGRDDAALYRGERLALAVAWAERRPAEPGPLTRAFLDASLRRDLAERSAAARMARRRVQLIVVLTVLLVVAVAAAGVAIQQRRVADEQRRVAIGRGLLAQAGAYAATQPRLSLMLGVAALRVDASNDARTGLVEGLAASPYAGTLTGHSDRVTATAFSPDGRLLATGSADRTVIVWEFTGGGPPRRRATLTDHRGPVASISFSPDGQTLAAGTSDGTSTVTLWDLGAEPRRLADLDVQPGDEFGAWSSAFSPDGRQLAVAYGNKRGAKGGVRLWDLTSRERPAPLSAVPYRQVWSVAYRPDAALVVGMESDFVTVLDAASPARIHEIGRASGHQQTKEPATGGIRPAEVFDVDLTTNGALMATAGSDRTAKLWNMSNPRYPREITTLDGHNGVVHAVEFSGAGRTLATRSDDGTVAVWDVADPARPVRRLMVAGQAGEWRAMALRPDGRTLATGTADNTVALWNVGRSEASRPVRLATLSRPGTVSTAAFSPDGTTLATGSFDLPDTPSLWDLRTPAEPIRVADLGNAGKPVPTVFALAMSPNGRTLATTDLFDGPRLWDVTDPTRPRPVSRPTGHTDQVRALAFSPDGRLLATGGEDNLIKLWDVADVARPRTVATLALHTDDIQALAFDTSGQTLASAGDDDAIVLWDLADPAKPRVASTLPGDRRFTQGIAFRPGSTILAAVNLNRTVELWDVPDPTRARRITTLTAHTDYVETVDFSPDGAMMATGGKDRTLVLWDLTDPGRPTQLDVLRGHVDTVEDVAFSPDGKTLVSAGGMSDHTVIVWDVSGLHRVTADPVEQACLVAGRGLDREEWATYAPGLPYMDTCA